MNQNRLKEVEANFLEQYPNGFEDDRIQAIIKKHNTAKLGEQVKEMFAKANFVAPALICDNFAAVVAKSTMVSLFEKPKVRDMVKTMSPEQKDMLSIGLYELLYGDKESGFESLVEILAHYKLAKWSLVSLIPYYFDRQHEFFIKPTTTKDIIKFFEIEDMVYKPRPSYAFYAAYKKVLEEIKKATVLKIDDNAGLTGFLMMGMAETGE